MMPPASSLKDLLGAACAWIMTLNLGSNVIKHGGAFAQDSDSTSIFINGNLARVLLASYKITGNKEHLAEGMRWCDSFVGMQHTARTHDGSDEGGWWDTGYNTLYIADTGTAVTTLALCYDLGRNATHLRALRRFDTFVRHGVDKTPQCTPVPGYPLPPKPHPANCSYDSGLGEVTDTWIIGSGADKGALGDGYYKGRLNLPAYTISTALTGGVFNAEMSAIDPSGKPQYEATARGAVGWLLRVLQPNGTIPYEIYPPSTIDHTYQCISYSTESFVDLRLRFGAGVEPQLSKLATTIEYMLAKQAADPSGALLPMGPKFPDVTTGEVYRSPRAASLLQFWHQQIKPDARIPDALDKYFTSWLGSDAGKRAEGFCSWAISTGFIALAAADLIQPWSTFAAAPPAA
jgi:hypothetical protein